MKDFQDVVNKYKQILDSIEKIVNSEKDEQYKKDLLNDYKRNSYYGLKPLRDDIEELEYSLKEENTNNEI